MNAIHLSPLKLCTTSSVVSKSSYIASGEDGQVNYAEMLGNTTRDHQHTTSNLDITQEQEESRNSEFITAINH